MNIGLDARYLSHGLMGGINTFLRNLTPALARQAAARGHRLFLYADTKRPLDIAQPPGSTLRLTEYVGGISSVRTDWVPPQIVSSDKICVMHHPANVGAMPGFMRNLLTLHDEINLLSLPQLWRSHRKTLRTIAMMSYLHLCSRVAVRRADLIATVSAHARTQILNAAQGAIAPEKIAVVHHGCPVDVRRVADPVERAEALTRLGVDKPFVLAEAFKNPDVIVRAWKRLPAQIRADWRIVFFARSAEVRPAVGEAVDAGWAQFFVRLPRPDLSVLMSATQAFVFPSWIEGFGLPLVEAMTCGAPVIASDRGSIPEVLGDAGWIMDAEDDAQLADYLTRLHAQPAEGARLRERGFARASGFTWDNAAGAYLDLYERLSPSPGRAGARPVMSTR
jgi:glycosyltransferase involved in cell wall biosynthesis